MKNLPRRMQHRSVEDIRHCIVDIFDERCTIADVYGEYLKNRHIYPVAIGRITAMGGYEEATEILKMESFPDDYDFDRHRNDKLLEVLQNTGPELYKNGKIDGLIEFYFKALNSQQFPYQKFLVCRAISALVRCSGKFPTKKLALAYFGTLCSLFKQSALPFHNNHMTALFYITKIDPSRVSKAEIAHTRKCALLNPEPIIKDLLCGFRVFDFNEPLEERAGHNLPYDADSNWLRLLEMREKGLCPEADMGLIALLRTSCIAFTVVDGRIRMKDKQEAKGLATRVFGIVKEYEIQQIREMPKREVAASLEKLVEPAGEKLVGHASPEKKLADPLILLFPNRHKRLNRQHKTHLVNHMNVFVDEQLAVRNVNRRIKFEKDLLEFENKKKLLSDRSDVINVLSVILSKIEAGKEEERMRAIAEREAAIQAEQEAERQARKWGGQRHIVAQPAAGQSSGPDKWMAPRAAIVKPTGASSANLYVPPKIVIEAKPEEEESSPRSWKRPVNK